MKKALALITVIFLLIPLLLSCSGSKDNGKPIIVTSNFALYDFARQIAGNTADVVMLIAPGSEAHEFEVTLNDINTLKNSALFIYVGGESEDWVDDIFESLGSEADDIMTLAASDYVSLLDEEDDGIIGAEEEEDEEESFDEHVWTSIGNAILISEAIRDELTSMFPTSSNEINRNAGKFISELITLKDDMTETVQNSGKKTLVVADRFPFLYMMKELGLDYYAAFSGCTSKTEISLATVNYLIDIVQRENVDTILTIEFSDLITARAISDETGCGIMTLYSCHNVSREDYKNGITYIDLMRHNLEVLKKALG